MICQLLIPESIDLAGRDLVFQVHNCLLLLESLLRDWKKFHKLEF